MDARPCCSPTRPSPTWPTTRPGGGLTGLRRGLEPGPGATIQEVILSGLRGRGGGGFPTGRKWQSVRDAVDLDDEDGGADRSERRSSCATAPRASRPRSRTGPSSGPTPTPWSRAWPSPRWRSGAERAFIGIKERFGAEADRLAAAVDEFAAAGLLDQTRCRWCSAPTTTCSARRPACCRSSRARPAAPQRAALHPRAVRHRARQRMDPGPAAWPPSSRRPTRRWSTTSRRWRPCPHILARGPSGTGRWAPPPRPGVVVATGGRRRRPARRRRGRAGHPLREVIEPGRRRGRPGRTIKAVLPGVANPVVTGDQLDVPSATRGWRPIGSGMGAAGFLVLDDTTSMVEVAQVVPVPRRRVVRAVPALQARLRP